MEVFHVGDKVFLDDVRDFEDYFEDFECDEIEYGTIEAINTENNLMTISPLINDKTDWWTTKINAHMDSPHIHKIDFLPKDHVIIHDLLKDYCNKRGVVSAYDRTIDRYRVIIDNDSEPHAIWFAPFELSLEDNLKKHDDDWNEHRSEHFVKSFSCFTPIKVKLSDDGKKAYEYHFGVKPLVDAQGRTEFTNLAYLYDLTFTYDDKLLLEDDEIFVKVMD